MSAGYAAFDGTQWDVQYDASGCPKHFDDIQAPAPLHLGGVAYKLYFGDHTDASGQLTTSPFPYPGPKKVLYADGAATGALDTVDFEDWEPSSQAHDLAFLWPDGTQLSETEEGYIDDFQMLMPTSDPDFQVMVLAMPGLEASEPPISAGALLLNP